MKRYVLSSAVLTRPGRYDYRHVAWGTARRWLAQGEYTSAVGFAATADAMHTLLGVRPAVHRQSIYMETGDEALVFRLRVRVTGDQARDGLAADFVAANSEVGLLKRVE